MSEPKTLCRDAFWILSILPRIGIRAWNSGLRAVSRLPSAESPSHMNISLCSGSLLLQSTNFFTLLVTSTFSMSFFFTVMRCDSDCSRLRLLISTWSMTLSASDLCSMNHTSICDLMRSERNSCMNLLFIAFLVWFSYEVCVENEFVTRIRLSCMSPKVILDSFAVYLPLVLISLSKAATMACLTALSGDPPCSRKDEL